MTSAPFSVWTNEDKGKAVPTVSLLNCSMSAAFLSLEKIAPSTLQVKSRLTS